MTRWAFIAILGWTAVSIAQAQQSSVQTIGFMSLRSAAENQGLVAAFRQGLREAGYVEGRNVAIEFRWADGRYERLPALAADLVARRVAVIATGGGPAPSIAAKAATSAIPIVFSGGSDPVAAGLVVSLGRPGGNVTGVLNIAAELTAKRLEFLLELAPADRMIAVLRNPGYPEANMQIAEIESAARTIGRPIRIGLVRTDQDLEPALADLLQQGAGALFVANDPFFSSRRERLATLAARDRVPAIYPQREYVEAGGLMSYGADFADIYRQVGVYTGRILNGEKPADIPVMRPTRFELVINRKTAKALGIELPNKLIALADDVID